MGAVTFHCDLSGKANPLPHYWEHTVGSGHATLALRSDWQRQLQKCHNELGFLHVRFHGLLCDDMSTLYEDQGELVYSFINTDLIFDFLISTGMKPFIELSFMPTAIASGSTTVLHYKANITQPKNYKQWATLISKLTSHWVQRYGVQEVRQWFFEVWNEPNLPKDFWEGTQKDYFKLYRDAAKAIVSVDDALQVGGPATAKNEWIDEFRDFCENNNVPVRFISTHHYPTDDFG
ncbi:MAG: beta-xylosidase, partial [Bryobacteraceae bacterium]